MEKALLTLLFMTVAWTGNAQLQNADFEIWENQIGQINNRPVGWEWSSGIAGQIGGYFMYPPETDAQNNTYALKLSVWYSYVKDVAIQTVPIATRPSALTGYYKYIDNVLTDGAALIEDIAQVSVYLTRWNAALSHKDTIGVGLVDLKASAGYKKFTVPVMYSTDEVPDTVTVVIDPSMVKRTAESIYFAPDMGFSSYFTVDNLVFEEASLSNPVTEGFKVSVYPNPVGDVLNIADFEGEVSIFDAVGKKIISGQTIERGKGLSVAQLPKGIYYLHLQDEARIHRQKFIKQ